MLRNALGSWSFSSSLDCKAPAAVVMLASRVVRADIRRLSMRGKRITGVESQPRLVTRMRVRFYGRGSRPVQFVMISSLIRDWAMFQRGTRTFECAEAPGMHDSAWCNKAPVMHQMYPKGTFRIRP